LWSACDLAPRVAIFSQLAEAFAQLTILGFQARHLCDLVAVMVGHCPVTGPGHGATSGPFFKIGKLDLPAIAVIAACFQGFLTREPA